MNFKRLVPLGGTLVLAVLLAGHLSTAAGPSAGDDVIAGEGCTSILVGKLTPRPTARS